MFAMYLMTVMFAVSNSLGLRFWTHRKFGLQIAAAIAAQMFALVAPVSAQCLDWATGFEPPPVGVGLNGPVYAMAIFDEDGPGGNPPSLFVGGHFTSAGGVAVNNLARWNGVAWSDVGGGVTGGSGYVLALHVGRASAFATPALYVGGNFTSAGAVGANNIARWNGATWAALGTGTAGNGGWVRSICEYWPLSSSTPMIYAGGDFTSAGGVTLNFIGRWNGTSWSALGATVGTSGGVFAMTVYGGNLVVGGAFPTAGLTDPNTAFIANWNGSAWSSFGTGMNSTVNALLVDAGSLYIGGNFTTASGTPANRIAKWNGSLISGFSALGTGTSGRVHSLAAFDDECGHSIYAGGEFTTAGGLAVNFIGRWVTNPMTGLGTWKTCGVGSISWVRALRPYFYQNLSALYAGGEFGAMGGHPSAYIAQYIAQDQDHDGLYDCWETDTALGGGIDINCDGVIDYDLFAHGARKDHKDVFVELDCMAGYGVLPGPINKVIDAFNAAPVVNPDGINGIKLHVEGDEFGIPAATWVVGSGQWPPAFDTFKTAHFGTIVERANVNRANILAAKKLAYRYCVFADNSQPDATSGMSEIGGNDFVISLGGWTPVGGTDDQKSGTFMHELGHTLGLFHGGGQVDYSNDARFNYKANYPSVMNYLWQTPKPWMGSAWLLSGGGLGYSSGGLRNLDETALIEAGPTAGMGGNPMISVPVAAPTPPFAPFTLHGVPMGGTVDWNFDTFYFGTPAVDCNHIRPGTPASPGDLLKDNDDWHALKYNFRDSADYADGQHQDISTQELTKPIDDEIAAMLPPVVLCAGDVNGDHVVNIDDLVAVIIAWGAAGGIADVTHNGVVDIDDLVLVITHWGACP